MRETSLALSFLGLLAAISFAPTSAQAQATRTWVSGVGDDVNPCSRTAPCKTFPGAISKTAAGGEINCLDPGGFGVLTVTKAITVDCTGVSGGILSAGTTGVIVNAGANDRVVLRNLVIQGAGTGTFGIRWLAGKELTLDRMVIQGLNATGTAIEVNKAAAGQLNVVDTLITQAAIGIRLANSSGNLVANIDRVRIQNLTGNGVEAASANVFANVSNSVISLPAATGTGAIASASGATMNVEGTTFKNNNVGASATVSGANLRLTDNVFWDNGTAINVVAGATFLSGGDNKVGGGNAGSNQTGAMVTK
jgi:hypothetical protein